MSAPLDKLILPPTGPRWRREAGELVIYEVSVTRIASVATKTLPGGRKVYVTSDGQVFTVAADAATHEYNLQEKT